MVGERVGCTVGKEEGTRVGAIVGSLVSPRCEGYIDGHREDGVSY